MRIQQNLNQTIGMLAIMNTLLAFGVIGLLVRMGPAIEKILQENVYSIVAAEDILVELSTMNSPELSSEAFARIDSALSRARINITEAEEIPALDAIDRNIQNLRDGDYNTKPDLINNLRTLIEINREAMNKVDQEAKRLSTAGAWAAAFIGFISFLASILIIRRLRTRVIDPIAEIYNVIESNRLGENFRRCTSRQAAPEIQHIQHELNLLLDERIANREINMD